MIGMIIQLLYNIENAFSEAFTDRYRSAEHMRNRTHRDLRPPRDFLDRGHVLTNISRK